MNTYSKLDIYKGLKELGIKKGDIIYINPEIYKLGLLKEAKISNDYFKIFFDVIFKVIGKSGTIAINSYTFQTLRFNKKFIYEKTISSSGSFSEFIRGMKESLRSSHPVFSVTSIGKNKKKICSSNAISNYGKGSPYDNFLKLNGKILNIGMSFELSPFFHVAEFFAGVSYGYNKLTKLQYFKNNKKINKNFSTFVTYKNLKSKRDYSKLKSKMRQKKMVKMSKLGSGYLYSYSARKYFDLVKNELNKNQFFLFKKVPKFKKGIFPNA